METNHLICFNTCTLKFRFSLKLLDMSVISQPPPHTKDQAKDGDLIVVPLIIIAHLYGEQSSSARMKQVLVSKLTDQMPHFPLT